jgi:hypothetical protein
MFLQVLDVSANVAVILLALEIMVLGLAPLFILLKITQGLRRLIAWFVPAMRTAQARVRQAQKWVERAMALLRAPFLWGNRASAMLRSSIQTAQQPFLRRR